MATTAKQLISYLQTLPEDTEIEILNVDYGDWSSHTYFINADLGDTDHFKYHPTTNTLYIGCD